MKVTLNRILQALKELLIISLKLVFSVGLGYLVYAFLAPVAYRERGYMAYGGECVLAIATVVLMACFLLHKRSKKTAKKQHPKLATTPIHPNCSRTVIPIFDYENQSGL